MSPSNSNGTANGHSGSSSNDKNKNYIEHQVSKLDTLAGVAIKYGVEVADIKRLNGLATDLQMFALKVLLIPLPGRHPPSPIVSNGSSPSSGGNHIEKTTPPRPRYSDILESFGSLRLKSSDQKLSPAMSTLQKYYGLGSSADKNTGEGTELAVYRTGFSDDLSEALLPKASPVSAPPYSTNKARGSRHTLLPENGEVAQYLPLAEAVDAEGEKSTEKSVRRRQKAEADSKTAATEKFLKEENLGGSSGFLPVNGKSLATKPKSASRASLAPESEAGWLNSIPVGMGDSIITDGLVGVRKSSSTPSLQDPDNSNSSSIWTPAKWSLKPDLQALSNAAITIPIFDGLPKPISGRRSKAALD